MVDWILFGFAGAMLVLYVFVTARSEKRDLDQKMEMLDDIKELKNEAEMMAVEIIALQERVRQLEEKE